VVNPTPAICQISLHYKQYMNSKNNNNNTCNTCSMIIAWWSAQSFGHCIVKIKRSISSL